MHHLISGLEWSQPLGPVMGIGCKVIDDAILDCSEYVLQFARITTSYVPVNPGTFCSDCGRDVFFFLECLHILLPLHLTAAVVNPV